MTGALAHRGPDDTGWDFDEGAGLLLAHTRLSVVDLSPAGHQPMTSRCGRYRVVYNGEIYNHQELRRELPAGTYRGTSDTEVLVEAFAAWGVRRTLQRLNGMFAFAVWDREERCLTLARDRLGEKPLFHARHGGMFLFGSELKALYAEPSFRPVIDPDSLALYFRHGYVPAPYSIFHGVRKLPPGTYLEVGAEGDVGPIPYWSAVDVALEGAQRPMVGSEEELLNELEVLLSDSVSRRMVADVPLGALLSGGVDSSLVVALMAAASEAPIRTFTVGFAEASYDEMPAARAVAAALGTEHTDIVLTPADLLDAIPRVPHVYDEPFADSSQIPTMLVAQLAHRHVTVALSGDGGDEVFGGYDRYAVQRLLWQRLRHLPLGARRPARRALERIAPTTWERILGLVGPALPRSLRSSRPGDKVLKALTVLDADGPDALYRRLMSHHDAPQGLVPGSSEPPTPLTDASLTGLVADDVDRMMLLDTIGYLPDDILTKVDRASMATSLELRVPLLDHRVVEQAWRLPRTMRADGPQPKWALRALLDRHVPRELVDRPKMGFGVPIGQWLEGPLRSWADDLLSTPQLDAHGLLDTVEVQRLWSEHRAGRRDWKYLVWDVLMFQSWYAEWMSSDVAA